MCFNTVQLFRYVLIKIVFLFSKKHPEDGLMNGRNMLVTIIQQKYINKIKVHLLICNTFPAFNLCTKHGTYQSTGTFTFFLIHVADDST